MSTQLVIPQGTISGQPSKEVSYNPFDESIGGSGVAADKDAKLGLLIGNSGRKLDDGRFLYQVITINLDSPALETGVISVPFLGHGLAFNPLSPEKAALFEKRGRGGCEINFKTGKMERVIHTRDNRQFYGHGTYSPDGKILYAAETITEGDFDGVIVMRDAETLEEIGEFPSYGARPHDCQLLSDGQTMIITNGGGLFGEKEKGSVTYVDIGSHKLLKKLPIENKRFNAGHVAVADNGDIVVVSAPREGLDFAKENGGVTIGGETKAFTGANAPRKVLDSLRGESLSVCVDNATQTAATTTPEAGRVSFWDMKTGQLKHTIKVKHPRGVTMTKDKKYFVINYDNPDFKVSLVDADTLDPVTGFDINIPITGSHIVNYAF